MKVSALTSSLSANLTDAISQLAFLGFEWIDVPPTAAKGVARQMINERALKIGCVGLEREPPKKFDLASHDKEKRSQAVRYFRNAIELTAELEAPAGYLTPPGDVDDKTRGYWCESLIALGDHARIYGVKVCIEHFPRRLVPTVKATQGLLDELRHDHVLLLVDVGHCLISREEPADAVRLAGKRLGYIHFDDNDGREDLHWALLAGRLLESQIESTIQALRDVGYKRTLCLEFNAAPDSAKDLKKSKSLLEKYLTA